LPHGRPVSTRARAGSSHSPPTNRIWHGANQSAMTEEEIEIRGGTAEMAERHSGHYASGTPASRIPENICSRAAR
jgi:hypothetical protein